MAVQSAFVLKAELAAGRAAVVNGYAAAVLGLTNDMLPVAGVGGPISLNWFQWPSSCRRGFCGLSPPPIR
jgi:hypothetical protein